ncbi:hypothetical protein D3C87_279550 [compost metagenome]
MKNRGKWTKLNIGSAGIQSPKLGVDFNPVSGVTSEEAMQDVFSDIFPYVELSRKAKSEADEHQQAQTYWTEQGTQRISLL